MIKEKAVTWVALATVRQLLEEKVEEQLMKGMKNKETKDKLQMTIERTAAQQKLPNGTMSLQAAEAERQFLDQLILHIQRQIDTSHPVEEAKAETTFADQAKTLSSEMLDHIKEDTRIVSEAVAQELSDLIFEPDDATASMVSKGELSSTTTELLMQMIIAKLPPTLLRLAKDACLALLREKLVEEEGSKQLQGTVRKATQNLTLDVTVHKTLILPHVCQNILWQILESEYSLMRDLCLCLGVDPKSDNAMRSVVELCMCGDLMPSNDVPVPGVSGISGDFLQNIGQWFDQVLPAPDAPAMTDDTYRTVVIGYIPNSSHSDLLNCHISYK